jgi:hypothetical protein
VKLRRAATALLSVLLLRALSADAPIRVEGENPVAQTMHRHPWWYDQVKTNAFSGGGFISNFDTARDGSADYEFDAPAGGMRDLWIHANPVQSQLFYALNGATESAVDFAHGLVGQENVAADGKPDLRFLAWVRAASVPVVAGRNRIAFRMSGANSHHGYLDCFVLADGPFDPVAATQAAVPADAADADWFAFAPGEDSFSTNSVFDLRRLNEAVAGEHGPIVASGGQFLRSGDRQPVRFWAVNGPPGDVTDPAELRRLARLLAKYGVNLVRLHGAVFDEAGEPDPARVRHVQDVVAAMKTAGIYTHLSVYFPLWLRPKADTAWLKGYDGKKVPFAALMFNPDFQAQYRRWVEALLLARGRDGSRLVDDPAVFGMEIQNEDSLFFWTFSEQNLPEPQLNLIETRFGSWLARKYGSAAGALDAWAGPRLKRDAPESGRIALRPLWSMANERTRRDQDTAAFLFGVQDGFYRETIAWVRSLGFRGLLHASNWTTADARRFGPLEKLSYTAGDFIDRHGYFGAAGAGEGSEWSIREGHTYLDRSALRFDGEKAGAGRAYVHPVMDPSYDGLPSMISETTWNRPNRHRPEAPLFLAAYGALQDSDAIVHFALDGGRWSVKPGYWMQPWTLLSPSQVGQFPATALLFRQGLVKPGDLLADVRLARSEVLDLAGTPLPQDAAFDELRLKDVPQGMTALKPGQVIDPLVHFAGRTAVTFADARPQTVVKDLSALVDRTRRRVTASTGELELDYGHGILAVRAPAAQGAGGNLAAETSIDLPDLVIRSPMDAGQILLVSLDGKPIAESGRMLLQVMNEERPSGWKTEPAEGGRRRILSIGHDPWRVRRLEGTVELRRSDATKLRVRALDLQGVPVREHGDARSIRLAPDVVYYEITRR